MNWDKVKSAIGTIAPWLAGTLGTPVAGVAVQALCQVFGLAGDSATPENVISALAGATPQQLNDLRIADMSHAEKMQAMGYTHDVSMRQADSADIASVNTTMQSENANSAGEAWYQKAWRPANGFVVAAGSLISTIAMCWLFYMAINNHDNIALGTIPALATAVALILAVPGAAVGISAWHRGVMKVAQVEADAEK